jgi:hypothetical protein
MPSFDMPLVFGGGRLAGRTAASVAAESDREMARYDQLGPLARAAVRDAPREIDIAAVVRDFKTGRPHTEMDSEGFFPPLDLKDPATDARLAKRIDDITIKDSGKPIEAHVLRPRRALRPRWRR